jgi:hypothetical protein
MRSSSCPVSSRFISNDALIFQLAFKQYSRATLARQHRGSGTMDAEDRVNREVLARWGLDSRGLRNTVTERCVPWLTESLREFKFDERDMIALGVFCVLRDRAQLTRHQAGAIAGAIRTGLDHEPKAQIWYVSYDAPAQRWRVAITPPADSTGMIALDVGRVRAKLAALRDVVAEELGLLEQPE